MKITFLFLVAGLLAMAPTLQADVTPADKSPLAPFTPAADERGGWSMTVNPELPNVLIIGDSISIGYTRAVRKLMAGKANVFRPMQPNGKNPDNCGDTTIGLANLDRWLGTTHWDVIHFNWGLWDLCYRDPKSKNQGNRDKVHGKLSTPPADYERNLETLVTRLKATGAKLIWASTTVVPEGEDGRIVGDDAKYNAIAARVMQRHAIPTDDLHSTAKAFPPALSVKPGDVHYTAEGYNKLAAQVAAKVTDALEKPAAALPNIIFILADDLGYGDVRCLNPTHGKIPTPHLDKMAAQGMTFTDAHSSSAVCTPSRYSILTGRYNWRSHLQSGVIGGFSPPLINPERLTVAELLKQQGYQTAVIGKWHLGMDFTETNGKRDLTGKISNGPTTHGFDYFFGISASLDMAPFAFIENDHFTQAPTVIKEWVRPGPAAPDFEAVDVLPEFTRKAKEFIGRNVKAKQPFFLYMPLTSPHTPLVPTKEWQGKSGLGDYGDFVMETDWAVGEVLAELDRSGAGENTLVLMSSDNGCAPYVGDSRQVAPPESTEPNNKKDTLSDYQKYQQLEALGHFSSYPFRGHKADIWEGGHRVPLLARWPAKVKAGSISDQLVCLMDFMATCADISGGKIPETAAEDSVSFLPALLGKTAAPLRDVLVSHSINGSFAIRQGNWKLILCPDSGGWGDPKPGSKEAATLPPVQLYDMAKDPGERLNEASAHSDITARLTALLEKQVADGRSTPGPRLDNDAPVKLLKSPAAQKAGR